MNSKGKIQDVSLDQLPESTLDKYQRAIKEAIARQLASLANQVKD